jgi:hypothetical protein
LYITITVVTILGSVDVINEVCFVFIPLCEIQKSLKLEAAEAAAAGRRHKKCCSYKSHS